MDIFSKYSIAFKGLKTGCYHYDFQVRGDFFRAFECSEIKDGDCRVEVDMHRADSALTFDVDIRGAVTVECDRCLEDCSLPVEYSGQLAVKFSDEIDDYDGEVMWINPGESEVNLAQYIYESVELSLPYQRVHPEDEEGRPTCDPDMLGRFRIVSEEEFEAVEQEAERSDMETIEQKLAEGSGMEKLAELKRRLEADN